MNAPTPTASAHTHVGTAPLGCHQEWMKHTVHYHGFGSLSTVRGAPVHSPEFMLLENPWRLKIYTGGSDAAAEGKTTLGLCNRSNKAIEIDYGFSVNDGNGKQVAYTRSTGPRKFTVDSSWGFHAAKRTTLMSSLVDGTLVIQIHMRLANPTKSVPPPFIPENPSACRIIQGVFMEEKYSDIVFEVGVDQRKDNAMKVAKIARERFPAHRVIVSKCSSVFADLCEAHNDDTTPIQINDVTPDIFRFLLNYIYGGKLSDDDMKSHVREIIDATDKYEVVSLKLEAEACLVAGTAFTVENVKELLIYAESKNCALLKESAMDFIVDNKVEVIEKLSFNDVPGGLVKDVLVAWARGDMMSNGANDNTDRQYNALRISELRKRAHNKGLNVDGSREMLIAALKGA